MDAQREPFRDVPFEFVGKLSSARAMAKASDVESGASTRHVEPYMVFVCKYG